ncbi:hypothetical protein EV702DRAFT_1208130 [Suillus placidus]|uniref:Uncharacterized protein n=1 Tax=Suillus placidus TaxID=48579 RepID=A0A9P6ZGM2_9AGAM|nr:hypothetical protein EV702DRAFT_1208130 [Suillus placidus]
MPARRRGQNKARAADFDAAIPGASAAIPAAYTIPTASTVPAAIPAAIPAAAAANATTLQNPRRRQLPVRYRTTDAAHAGPDEGEVFNLDNISGDEEELGNLPAPTAVAPAGSNPSPLQTVTSTVRTDPLATGNLKQTKGPTDISHFYQIDTDTKTKTCIPCETLHKIDTTHKVMVYAGSTSCSAPHTHAFNHHTKLYLEAAERFGWRIQIKDLNEYLAEGWSLTTIREWLKKSPCMMQSLGPPPNQGSGALLVGMSFPEDRIPDFMLDEMHRQIVKFIVADDQAINMIECPEFRRLIRLLRPEIGESGLFHRTKAREMVIEQWQEYFLALKQDLAIIKDQIIEKVDYIQARHDRFHETIVRGNEEGWFQDDNGDPTQLPVVELLLNEPTRWDSVYVMINHLQTLRQAVIAFFDAWAQRGISEKKLCEMDWQFLQDLEVILEAPHAAQQKLSSESTPMLSHAVPTFEELADGWESIGLHAPHCKPVIDIGLTWASKYTDRMGATHAYSVAMFIDPAMWMSWMDSRWKKDRVDDAKEFILKLMQSKRVENSNSMHSHERCHAHSAHVAMDFLGRMHMCCITTTVAKR